MFTTGSKFFFGLARLRSSPPSSTAGAPAARSAWTRSSASLTLGYKGGVGDHLGYTVLIALSAASPLPRLRRRRLPRRRPRAAQASLPASRRAPVAPAPPGRQLLAVVGAFGAGARRARPRHRHRSCSSSACVVLAVATSSGRSGPGPTGPPATPRSTGAIRNRLMDPIEVPVARRRRRSPSSSSPSPGSSSPSPRPAARRVRRWSPARDPAGRLRSSPPAPSLSRNVVAGLLVVGALAVLAGGVIRAATGPRTIEEHHEEEGGEDGEHRRPRPAAGTARRHRGPPPMTRPDLASAEGMGDTRTVPHGWLAQGPRPRSRCWPSRWPAVPTTRRRTRSSPKGPQARQHRQPDHPGVHHRRRRVRPRPRRRASSSPSSSGQATTTTTTSCPTQIHGNIKLEIGWTILPALILAVVGRAAPSSPSSTSTRSRRRTPWRSRSSASSGGGSTATTSTATASSTTSSPPTSS